MAKQESLEEYADRFFDQGSFPLFKGANSYRELFGAGRIEPFMNYVRVTLGGIIHLFYCADENGKLVDLQKPDLPACEPNDILKGQWQLESIVPKRLAKKRE
jgi:hypothetical protein